MVQMEVMVHVWAILSGSSLCWSQEFTCHLWSSGSSHIIGLMPMFDSFLEGWIIHNNPTNKHQEVWATIQPVYPFLSILRVSRHANVKDGAAKLRNPMSSNTQIWLEDGSGAVSDLSDRHDPFHISLDRQSHDISWYIMIVVHSWDDTWQVIMGRMKCLGSSMVP